MDDKEKMVKLLHDYFTIGDSYAYNLTRDKAAFGVGTMSLEDFEEFDIDTVADLADHLISHGVTVREQGGYSDDDCFREKIEHQLKGIYEHLRDVDSAIDTLRAQTLPLRENVIHWFTESNMHKNVGGSECHCGAPMKGESK